MKNLFIINPVAGGRDITASLTAEIFAAASSLNIPAEDILVLSTTHPGHARQLAQEHASAGQPIRIFAVGGDGTLNEVLSGAYPYKNAAVGCIPYGSGNDFIRNYGVKEEFLDLADQLSGGELDIDLLSTNLGVGASICSAGLDAEIAYDIPRFRRLPFCKGENAYRLSILLHLFGSLGRSLKMTLDGEEFIEDCLLTAICNGGYYGGGFFAAPGCSLQDGCLDVLIIRKIGLLRIAKVLPQYQKGLHLKDHCVVPALADVVEYRRCRTVRVEIADNSPKPIIANVDGECRPARELSVEVLPLAGRVILPAAVYARQKASAEAL